ncbi:SPOR domain-containing protein [Bacteroidota bacterium]
MTKKELVRIISKKAAVVDTSAKDLFDLFLRRLPAELQLGESAQFSNVGHFHFRKGKIKKESTDADGNRIEYLDLIIFSPSSGELDIKSADNLVFSVPDVQSSNGDDLDAHFSLSVGKPVLPNLEGSKSTVYSTDELQEILNHKVENLMVNLRKDESAIADSEILLLDIKDIDQDQFELELDEKVKLKNSEKSDNSIHSSEQLKSIAWSFGKDLSNQMDADTLSDDDIENDLNGKTLTESSEFGDRGWDETDSESEIDTSESTIDNSVNSYNKTGDTLISPPGEVSDEENKLLEISDQETIAENNSVEQKDEKADKIFDLTEITNDDVNDLTEKKIEEAINADELAESLLEEVDMKDLEIEMNDFEVSDNDEKMGKFERVRSISSSINQSKPIKEIEGFDNFIEDKINITSNSVMRKNNNDVIENSDDEKELLTSPEPKNKTDNSLTFKEKKKGLKLNRLESKKISQKYDRKSSRAKFLIVFAIMAGVVAIIYLLTNNEQSTSTYDEVVIPPKTSANTTYIERTYEIPVNYPYAKPEVEIQVDGLGPSVQNAENINESKPPVEVVSDRQEPPISKSGNKPSGTPVQAAYSIYQYENTFVVQVSAFRSETTARQEVEKYVTMGYISFIERATIDGALWFRVRVGNFDTLEDAKQFRTSHK